MFHKIGSYITDLLGETQERRSYIQEVYRQMADFYTIGDFLPFDRFDPIHDVFINDHSWGFVLETPPLVGCSEAMQKEINNLFVVTLPEESSLQTILWADSNIGDVLGQYVGLRRDAADILQTLSQ